jgi:hypothetical protein
MAKSANWPNSPTPNIPPKLALLKAFDTRLAVSFGFPIRRLRSETALLAALSRATRFALLPSAL